MLETANALIYRLFSYVNFRILAKLNVNLYWGVNQAGPYLWMVISFGLTTTLFCRVKNFTYKVLPLQI
jgi:hypothetical protein